MKNHLTKEKIKEIRETKNKDFSNGNLIFKEDDKTRDSIFQKK